MSLGWQDAAWIPLAGLSQIPAQWLYNSMPIADTANLRRDDLPFFDRWVAGTYRPKAATLSDFLIVPFCALPTALSAFDSWRMGTGWRPVATDLVVFAEALSISSALDLAARSMRMHPRPLVYGADRLRRNAAPAKPPAAFTRAMPTRHFWPRFTCPIRIRSGTRISGGKPGSGPAV